METRMQYGEDEPSTRAKDTVHAAHCGLQFRDVHERHEADDTIELRDREAVQRASVGEAVLDVARLASLVAARNVQQLRRDIDASDNCAPVCEVTREAALPTRQIAHA